MPQLAPLLRDAGVPSRAKAELVRDLVAEKRLAPAGVAAAVARWPLEERRFGAVDALARLLEEQGAYEAAGQLYDDFLHGGRTEALDDVLARTGDARMLYHRKKFSEAWAVVAPMIASQQRGAMARGALVLQALGKAREAEDLARRQLARYPQVPDAAGVVAEVLWRQARWDDAAGVLAPMRIGLADWRFQIGPHLVAAVDDGVDARAALQALGTARVDASAVEQLALTVAQTRRHDPLAIELLATVRAPGLMQVQIASEAAASVKRSKAAASEWLARAVPVPLRSPLSQFAFAEKLDEALWNVVPGDAPGPRENLDCIWLFRAASSLRTGAHAAEARAYFAGSGSTRYFTLGRVLLGLAAEPAALAEVHDFKSACEVAYWLGYQADVEHRIADAVTHDLFARRLLDGRARAGAFGELAQVGVGDVVEQLDRDRQHLVGAELRGGFCAGESPDHVSDGCAVFLV